MASTMCRARNIPTSVTGGELKKWIDVHGEADGAQTAAQKITVGAINDVIGLAVSTPTMQSPRPKGHST